MSQLQVTGEAKIRTLTGALTATAGVVTSVPLGAANGVATLGGDGKVPSAQLPTMASSYKGTWNAATNTPTIADGVGTAGDYYLVSTGGTWNGIVFLEGNTVIYSGTVWQKAGGGSGTVTSVGLAAPAAFSVSGSPVTSTGTLTLAGAGTTNDYIKGDGTLAVFNSAAISAVSGTYLALAGSIMTGQIVLKEGTTISDYTKGLRFPNDPYGGSGDTSGLRLYAETTTGAEAQVLELYVTNDGAGVSQDRINLEVPSNDLATINGNKIWNAGNLTPQTQLNGTGFVKATGTTISYDNSTYLTTSAASSTYLPLAGGTLTGPLGGTSATFNTTVAITLTASDSRIIGGNSTGRLILSNSGTSTYAIFHGATHATNPNGILLINDNIESLKLTNTGAATFSSSITTATDLISSNGTLYISAGSGLSYSSRLSTVYNFPYVDTYLDSFGGASYEGRLNFRTNSGGGAMSTKMTILNNGSVGIGTTTPNIAGANNALSINSSDYGVIEINKNNARAFYIYANDGQTFLGNFTSSPLIFRTADTEKARITSSGSLLVATSTDLGSGYKLQVNGSISMAYANFFNFKGSSGAGDVLVDNSGSSLRVSGLVQFDSNVTFTSTALVQGLLTNYNVYNTQTSSYTLVLSDASKIIEMNVGSANTVTIPTNASVAFPIGTEITVLQYGGGVTSIAVASGVTIVSKDNANIIANRYTGVTLIKRATNEWYIIGNVVI